MERDSIFGTSTLADIDSHGNRLVPGDRIGLPLVAGVPDVANADKPTTLLFGLAELVSWRGLDE